MIATRSFLISSLTALSVCALLAHLILAYWSFPQADDIFIAAEGMQFGFMGAFQALWNTLTGRFTSTPLIMMIYGSGYFPYATYWFVIAGFAAFIAALILFCGAIGGAGWRVACIDAAFLLLVLPRAVKQGGIYWLGETIIYLLPIAIVLAAIALARRPFAYSSMSAAALFLCSFLLSGFNEQLALLILVLAAGHLLIFGEKAFLTIALGIGLGLCVGALSPGNHVRQEGYVDTRGYETALLEMPTIALAGMAESLLPFLIPIVAYGFLRANAYPSFGALPPRKLLHWALIVFAALFASFLVVVYGYNGRAPADRTLLTPLIFLFLAALVSTAWVGRKWPRAASLCLLALMAPSLYHGGRDLVVSLGHAREMRQVAIAQFSAAKAAAQTGAELAALPAMQHKDNLLLFREYSSNPRQWKNESLAKYFQLRHAQGR